MLTSLWLKQEKQDVKHQLVKEKKKNKGKQKKRLSKEADGTTRKTPEEAKKKTKEKKRKTRKKRVTVREASEQEATEGGVARLERQEGAGKAVEASTAGKRKRNKDKDKVVLC